MAVFIQNIFQFINLVMKFDKIKAEMSHRTRNDLVQPHVSGKTFEDSINPSEGLFFIDLSCKFLVFRKNDNM